MKLEGDNFSEYLQVELDKYQVEVGILEDKPVRAAIPDKYKTYAGQQLAAVGHKIVGSLVDIARELDSRFHWLERPWRLEQNREVQEVVNDIAAAMNGGSKQRVLNGIQAIIRNPILRGDYGNNKSSWAKIKGFNKLLMWTGQFFQNIRARYVP